VLVWTAARQPYGSGRRSVARPQSFGQEVPPSIRADVASGSVVRLVGWFRESLNTPPVVAVGAVNVE
jgi:hypothetical protein